MFLGRACAACFAVMLNVSSISLFMKSAKSFGRLLILANIDLLIALIDLPGHINRLSLLYHDLNRRALDVPGGFEHIE